MENENEKAVNNLKFLLSITNDGKEGFKSAAENVDSPELKALLTTYSIQRAEQASDLKTCIRKTGGDPDNDTGGPLGAIHRAWIEVKTAFTTNDNKAVLEACITGEKSALDAYDEILKDESLDPGTRQVLISQREAIANTLTNIESLDKQHA
ncbi:PA2169 family four-helix-bundle protein [Pedobacter sp. HMF7647]|uniref:PA2169 family four-helix-bundle protein n=1 Tax=Hufsiella arboris TaxID=2695275 RepID=A0A7K1YFS3_9SPHI|nr:PA2169 family four-helix-bundle protein [Hufsiella arboris]MXV53281.1 PA2169 family four-helix-bundle protein [Hufsiella arboris]